MFSSSKTVSLSHAKERFADFIGLSNTEANALARYVIEPRESEKLKKNNYTISIDKMMENIEDLVKPYKEYSEDYVSKCIKNFILNNTSEIQQKFANFLKNNFELVDSITVNEMKNKINHFFEERSEEDSVISNSQIEDEDNCFVEVEPFIAFLLKESNSGKLITGESIKNLHSEIIKAIESLENHENAKDEIINPCRQISIQNKESDVEDDILEDFKSESLNSDNLDHNIKFDFSIKFELCEISANDRENPTRIIEIFVEKLGKFLNIINKTLFDIVHHCIHDRVFNSIECQLIESKKLFICLQRNGFNIDNDLQKIISIILTHQFTDNDIDVLLLQSELEANGAPSICCEDSFKNLSGSEIRIINRIIEELKKNNQTIYDFIVRNNSKSDYEIVEEKCFSELLENSNIIRDDDVTDDLNSTRLIELMVVSPTRRDILLLKKINRCIDIIQENRYFSYFSCEFRDLDKVNGNLAKKDFFKRNRI